KHTRKHGKLSTKIAVRNSFRCRTKDHRTKGTEDLGCLVEQWEHGGVVSHRAVHACQVAQASGVVESRCHDLSVPFGYDRASRVFLFSRGTLEIRRPAIERSSLDLHRLAAEREGGSVVPPG